VILLHKAIANVLKMTLGLGMVFVFQEIPFMPQTPATLVSTQIKAFARPIMLPTDTWLD